MIYKKEGFKPNDCSQAIICNLYPEVSLHTRINNKGIMLPSLACKSTPGIVLHLQHKYSTANYRGLIKNIKRINL